jgi:CRP-like cAMP-binding protein
VKAIVKAAFDPHAFLGSVSEGRSLADVPEGRALLRGTIPADALFSLRKSRSRSHALASHGKEAVVAILGHGDFFGEGGLAGSRSVFYG